MFIELIDALRCVQPHEPTWLVASIERAEGRYIERGVLGCPICRAEYPVIDGVADFRVRSETRGAGCGSDGREEGSPRGAAPDPSVRLAPAGRAAPAVSAAAAAPPPASSDPLEAAALLNLDTPGGFVVLAGEWSGVARQLVELVEGVHILSVNPVPGLGSGSGVSLMVTEGELPLRPGVARGIVLDESHGSPTFVAAAAAALRPGGRLVAPASVDVPDGILELARDGRRWVGEAGGAQRGVVELTRRRTPRG